MLALCEGVCLLGQAASVTPAVSGGSSGGPASPVVVSSVRVRVCCLWCVYVCARPVCVAVFTPSLVWLLGLYKRLAFALVVDVLLLIVLCSRDGMWRVSCDVRVFVLR